MLKCGISTDAPVHLRDRVSVQAVSAFTAETMRSEQSGVNLDEGEEKQERSRRVPAEQEKGLLSQDRTTTTIFNTIRVKKKKSTKSTPHVHKYTDT